MAWYRASASSTAPERSSAAACSNASRPPAGEEAQVFLLKGDGPMHQVEVQEREAQVAQRLVERLGRPRNFESHGARWLLANARPACELGGAAAAVYLTLRGRTPAAMFERHLRSLRAAVLGALTGHLGARLAVRPEDAIEGVRSTD